jgi:tetratricopeptide (TPR) repeat protein
MTLGARRLLVLLAATLVLAAVALAYAPAYDAPLLWDDHALVTDALAHRHAPVSDAFARPFWPGSAMSDAPTAYYRPIVLLTLRFDVAGGESAAQLHLTNVALHLLACALLAVVAWRLGAPGAAAVTAALLWALAPRLTEAVAWISGRTDVLAGALALAALAASPDVARAPARASPRGLVAAGASGALLLLALLSKEVALAAAVTLGAALILPAAERGRVVEGPGSGDARGAGERRHRLARGALSVVVPVAVYAALRARALAGVGVHHHSTSLPLRAATVFEALGRYAWMTVDAVHPRTSIGMMGDVSPAFVAAGVALFAGAAALVAWRARRALADRARREDGPRGDASASRRATGAPASRGIVLGAVLGASALTPVLQIVRFGINGAVVADRLLYLPLAGLAIAAAVATASRSRRVATAAGAAALAAAALFAVTTRARAADYRHELGFWVVAAENAHPSNTVPRSALAAEVRDAGDAPLACRLFAESVRVQRAGGRTTDATHRRTRENLAACLARIGRYDESIAEYAALARAHPDSGRIHMGLAYVRMHTYDFQAARAELARAVALDPRFGPLVAPATKSLATADARAARFAAEDARRADPLAYADFLAEIGRVPDAARELSALARDPSAPKSLRSGAVMRLLEVGSVPAARSALAAFSGLDPQTRAVARKILRPREVRYDRLLRLEPRIERLAGPSG